MNNNVKVSVVVPIYNVEEYLDECLNSLLKQTLKDIEVLMIDDGSTDTSSIIARKYEKKYSNFHYIYKENGGLGQARNFAIPYVKGDYLIFLDSDDIVPCDAYKKMYDMAIKTGNDMVIGNVKRFNSSKEWDSLLHKKLFDGTYEYTSIYQKPELVYDTTSWNKLFKTSFYLENNFKFPENILYEDIPVTIPAHFKANSISMIDDICYLWRVRDGVSKSITQNRKQIINLKDRIEIMGIVNDYYTNNITDKKALYIKDFKWLDNDLKAYINEFLNVDNEYLDYAMKAISDFLKTINKDIMNEIRVIDRLKYYYIINGNKERLLEVLKYEKKSFKSLTITRKDNHYIGNLPFKDINNIDFSFEKELSNYSPVQAIENIYWDNSNINISGYFYLPKLKSQYDFKTEVYLENIHTKQIIPISIEKKESRDLTKKYGRKYSKQPLRIASYNYDNSRFTITIDANKLSDTEGVYKIKVNYHNDLINNTFTLTKTSKTIIKGNYLKYINDRKIYTRFLASGEIEILSEKVEKITLDREEGNSLEVTLNNFNKEIFMINKNNDEQKVDIKNGKLHLDNIDYGINYFCTYQDNNKINLSSASKNEYFYKDGNLWIFDNDSKGCFYIAKYKNVSFIKNIQKSKDKLIAEIDVLNIKDISPKLVLKNIKHNYLVEHNMILISNNGNYSTYVFEIDFKNDVEIVNNLAAGDYEIYVEYDALNVFEIKTFRNQYYSFVNGQYKYLFYVDDSSNLTMTGEYKYIKSENTVSKRRLIRKYVYPILRKKKIQEDVIVFESFWGRQYSCNPRYLSEYICENYPNMKCVWFLNDERIMVKGNVERVKRGTRKYYEYLATAKYFVNNVNFSKHYVKRKKQIEIQTMHGTPLKTLGLDVKEDFPTEESKKIFLEKCHRWDYLIVQSDWTAKYTEHCYDFKKDFFKTGYPRNDVLFKKNNDTDIAFLKEKMGLPKNKKVILYAPTWRKKNYFDMQLDIEDMQKKLGDEYILVLRLHHFSVKGLKEEILNDFVYNFSSYPTIQDLYLISDIMITDYSSVMFDYSILKRPMLFFTYDLVDYRDNLRGFNFDFEKSAPGPLLMNSDEVVNSILNIETVSKQYEEKYENFIKMFTYYEKGTASKQIVEKLFK